LEEKEQSSEISPILLKMDFIENSTIQSIEYYLL
jgi:hypothetical protein